MQTVRETGRIVPTGNSAMGMVPSAGSVEFARRIARRAAAVVARHPSASRELVAHAAKLVAHEAPLQVLRHAGEPAPWTRREADVLVEVIVAVRIMRLAERDAIADDVARRLRLVELGPVQVVAVEEHHVARLEFHVDRAVQLRARQDVAVAKRELGAVVLREDREPVAAAHGTDGDPDVDHVVRAIDPGVAMRDRARRSSPGRASARTCRTACGRPRRCRTECGSARSGCARSSSCRRRETCRARASPARRSHWR